MATAAEARAFASELIAEWEKLEGVAKCIAIRNKRLDQLKSRIDDPVWRDHWRDAVRKIGSSDFLTGDNDRGWKANIDWFLRPNTVYSIMEGKYHGQRNGRRERNERAFRQVFGDDVEHRDDGDDEELY